MYKLVPQLRAVYAFDAQMPEECVMLLRKVVTCASYSIDAHVPSYLEWFLGTDTLPVYREFKRMLQLLMWKFPGRYPVLKSPLHLYSLPALLEVFPDARIIQTHRDPRTVAASGCSLYEVLRTLYSVDPDPKEIGQDWVSTWGVAMSRAMNARKQADPGQFYDIDYSEFVADPMRIVQDIYSHFAMEFDDETAARSREWLAANPSEKHGKHSYSSERFGIDEAVIEQHFAGYTEEFGL